MVVALVAGAREAAQLSGMALGRGRRQRLQPTVALAGQCTAPHTTLMARALALVAVRGRQLTVSAQQRQEWRDPLAPQREPLARFSGANAIIACARLAERSLAMTHVGSAVRPGSVSRRGARPQHKGWATPSGRTRRGPRELRRVLGPWAWATRQPTTCVGWTLRRWEARVGGQQAAVAVAPQLWGILAPPLLDMSVARTPASPCDG